MMSFDPEATCITLRLDGSHEVMRFEFESRAEMDAALRDWVNLSETLQGES